MQNVIKFILIFTFIIFVSCNSSEDKKDIKSNQKINKTTQDINHKVQTIDRDTLKQFLPGKIPGTGRRPLKSGSIFQSNVIITTCSAEYQFANKGFLDFSITDYGAKSNIPEFDIKHFENPPKVSGMSTFELILPSGKGYVLWNENQKNGTFNGLILDRFVFKIDATRMPNSYLKLQDYIKYFKIDNLIDYIKKQN